MAATPSATVEFGPQNMWLDEELLQVLAAGNKVRFEELLRGEDSGGGNDSRQQTNDQVAINFHSAEPAPEPTRRGGTCCLHGVTSNGSTALHIVASHGHAELAALVCERAPWLAATRNRCLDTPLHCAARTGHRDVAACLLRTMPPTAVQARNKTGDTALHDAVRHDRVGIVDILMTTVPWLASITTDDGVSPLYMAAAAQSKRMVQVLLHPMQNGGPSPASAAGPEGRTALHVAATGMKVQLFLNGYTSLGLASISDNEGSYPVHAAAKFEETRILDELVEKCPNYYEMVDDKGRNLLHVAVEDERETVVRHICKNDNFTTLLNAEDSNGNTPFHLAVKYSYPQIFGLLLGTTTVDMCITNKDGHTAKDLALRALAPDQMHYFLINRTMPDNRAKTVFVGGYMGHPLLIA
uniref:Uncharacterized protein n=1 Tax=Leersia perrieri TaxID=77586 RepID=A0A0D9WZS5_9ORYZ